MMEDGGWLFTGAEGQRRESSNACDYRHTFANWDLETSAANRRPTNGSHSLDETAAPTTPECSGFDPSPNLYGFRAYHYRHPFYRHPSPPRSGGGGGVAAHRHHPFPGAPLTCARTHFFDEDAPPLDLLGDHHMAGVSFGLKRGRPGNPDLGGAAEKPWLRAAALPRCQVDGCGVALGNAKEYHRRHKVCDMHSKAPRVALLGVCQRFCQQCSRFHAVTEFDDAKRSCRRRLAGHNQRRRKTTAHDSISRNPSHDSELTVGEGRSCLSAPAGRASSLLSSKAESRAPPSDLSSRSSAALRELIEENRAAVLARQLMAEVDAPVGHTASQYLPELPCCDRFREGAHVTLDLMQDPGLAFDACLYGESPMRNG